MAFVSLSSPNRRLSVRHVTLLWGAGLRSYSTACVASLTHKRYKISQRKNFYSRQFKLSKIVSIVFQVKIEINENRWSNPKGSDKFCCSNGILHSRDVRSILKGRLMGLRSNICSPSTPYTAYRLSFRIRRNHSLQGRE